MFLFGILSTPLPYILMAFAYLFGISLGLFQKKDKISSHEEYTSNIINYEVLSPEINSEEEAHYTDFVKSNSDYSADAIIAFNDLPLVVDQFNSYSPPQKEFIQYQYLFTSNLFNRPPPVAC